MECSRWRLCGAWLVRVGVCGRVCVCVCVCVCVNVCAPACIGVRTRTRTHARPLTPPPTRPAPQGVGPGGGGGGAAAPGHVAAGGGGAAGEARGEGGVRLLLVDYCPPVAPQPPAICHLPAQNIASRQAPTQQTPWTRLSSPPPCTHPYVSSRQVVHVGDALSPAAAVPGGFSGIVVDLFGGGRLLPQLTKV